MTVGVEAFDDQLNRNLLAYHIQVQDTICQNILKRKEAPHKACAYAEAAFDHYRIARQHKSTEAELEIARLQEAKHVVNGKSRSFKRK